MLKTARVPCNGVRDSSHSQSHRLVDLLLKSLASGFDAFVPADVYFFILFIFLFIEGL